MPEIIGKWILLNQRAYERNYMSPLFNFVLPMFIEIFGSDIMSAEPCIVYNDPSEDVPMLITNSTPVKIRTNAKSLRHWAQFIFNLSHELTHYAIRQQKKDKDAIVKWFEETICEAMSMYILSLSASRWEKCELYGVNNGYAQSLQNYCAELYRKVNESVLQKCTSLAELHQVEMSCESDRSGRSIERNYLYDTFILMPNDIKTIIYYTQYIAMNGLQIDFDSWCVQDNSRLSFLNRLDKIQPSISA